MAERSFNWLLLLPPVLFISFGLALYAGLKRENANELPSSFIGQQAPELNLTEMTGKTILASDLYSGSNVTLVNFWASWCGPCRLEHPLLQKIADGGIPIIGVNSKDTEENALAFLEELGDPYVAIGQDIAGRTGIDWGVYGLPETFVIDGEGKVVLRFPGPITPSIYENRILPAIKDAQESG